MASGESGFLESSLSRTRSIIRPSLRSGSIIKRQSLQLFSHKNNAESEPRPSRRPSQKSRATEMVNASQLAKKKGTKSRMTSSKNKPNKKTGTILRAVPATAACAAAPLSPLELERDMETLPNQEILSRIGGAGRISPTSDGQASFRSFPQVNLNRTRTRSSSGTALSPIAAGQEMKFPDLKATIGIYKHGRIQWEQKDRSSGSSSSQSIMSGKSQRPKIQVMIPDEKRNRPLPTSPFFGQAPFSHADIGRNNHIRSASAEFASTHDISPPSGSNNPLVRQSVVSPLSSQQQQQQQQQQQLATTHFQPLVAPNMSRSESESESSSQRNGPSQSNSSDESHEDDASSVYSKRSSMTSIGGSSPPRHPRMNFHERTASKAFSITSPVVAGIFDENVTVAPKSDRERAETGPRMPTPSISAPRRYAPHPPIEEDGEFIRTCALRPLRTASNTLQRRPSTRPSNLRRASKRSSYRSFSADPTMGVINQAINRTETMQYSRNTPSPTLSEAANDLVEHLESYTDNDTYTSFTGTNFTGELTSYTNDNPFKWDEIVLQREAATNNLSATPPALPRKSSKRHSHIGGPDFRLSRVPCDHIASQINRNRSLNKGKGLKIDIPGSKRMTDDFFLSPIPPPPKAVRRTITPSVAENVVLTILRNLDSLDDLFAFAVVNRGFYRVFKRYELELMKSALRNMSPPAWEHREICYPGHDEHDDEDLEVARPRKDYTPTTYLQYYTRDMYIIAALKSLIKDKCESFLRPEIGMALVSNDALESARVDDALWRIWTFCKIFGSGRGREEDIVAQMDWLKGGVLVHQKTCTYSILTTDAIDMNDTLASAPECFAMGNEGGLTAEQLFDMMELWNCLGVLLQPFEGRTIQAREYGVYENTDVRGGDIDGEEMMLDEWYYYLLTLGLSPILDLAAPCRQSDPSAFILASQNGWMEWKPPVFGGTRRNFLKEAASRVYEDKIAVVYAESSTKEVQRQLSKQRIQRHITELRQRKNSHERLPPIRMSQERPISEWEDVINNLTRPRPPPSTASNLVSHIPTLRSTTPGSALAQQVSSAVSELEDSTPPLPVRPRSPPRRVVAQPLLPTPPPSTVPSDHRSSIAPSMPSIDEHPAFRMQPESIPEMPALEDHPAFAQHLQRMNAPPSVAGSSSNRSDEHPAFQQHPLQREIYSSDSAENTAEKAVYRIVEMGFTPEQARQALRMTDLGDGLRVDRAVELLLREG